MKEHGGDWYAEFIACISAVVQAHAARTKGDESKARALASWSCEGVCHLRFGFRALSRDADRYMAVLKDLEVVRRDLIKLSIVYLVKPPSYPRVIKFAKLTADMVYRR